MTDFYLLTNPGERNVNEDYIGMKEAGGQYCFILADGLGGHGSGEVASKSVVENGLEYFEANYGQPAWQEDVFPVCEDKLMELQKEMHNTAGMKTTMVVLKLDPQTNSAQYVHVGDSRGYYFENGEYKSRTRDHSVPQMLAKSGEITEEEIRRHPDRNKVLRVMGIEWEDPEQEAGAVIPIVSGTKQAFLLCTDGFWDWITEPEMSECLKKSSTAKEWVDSMLQIVLQNGTGKGMDNYSVIAVIVNNVEAATERLDSAQALPLTEKLDPASPLLQPQTEVLSAAQPQTEILSATQPQMQAQTQPMSNTEVLSQTTAMPQTEKLNNTTQNMTEKLPEKKKSGKGKTVVKIILSIVLCGVILFIGGISLLIYAIGSKSRAQKKIWKQAESYYAEQSYDEALLAYEEYLEKNSKNEDAYLRIAEIYEKYAEEYKANGDYTNMQIALNYGIKILQEGVDNTSSQSLAAKLKELKDLSENYVWFCTGAVGSIYNDTTGVNIEDAYSFEYNEKGQITLETWNLGKEPYSGDMDVEIYAYYDYDDNGNNLGGSSGYNMAAPVGHYYEYNDANELIKYANGETGFYEVTLLEYIRNEAGRIDSVNLYDGYLEGEDEYGYGYDEFYGVDFLRGDQKGYVEYEYENNTLKKTTEYDMTGNVICTEEFNDRGKLVSFDADSMYFNEGIYIPQYYYLLITNHVRFEYDENGNNIRTTYYTDESESYIQAEIKYHYDLIDKSDISNYATIYDEE